MATSGDVIEHPVTGERITFLETSEERDGEYAMFELRVRPHGFVAAPHVHPIAEESFEIRSGTFTFVVDGEERQVRAGEGATVPAGATHAWWNAGEEEGVAIVEFRPALQTEEFFESFFGLAQDGKVSPKTGLPNVLWLAAIFRTYRDFGYVARPPLLVQRAIFTPLGALAWLLGYRLPRPYPCSAPRTERNPRIVSRKMAVVAAEMGTSRSTRCGPTARGRSTSRTTRRQTLPPTGNRSGSGIGERNEPSNGKEVENVRHERVPDGHARAREGSSG